jgi:hypothetical protein
MVERTNDSQRLCFVRAIFFGSGGQPRWGANPDDAAEAVVAKATGDTVPRATNSSDNNIIVTKGPNL